MRALVADAFPTRHLDELRALGLTVTYEPTLGADELPARVADVRVLVVRSTKVTRATIEAAPELGLVLRAGAGVDTIDVDAASERGIYVSNCPGKNAVAVAELAMGLILALDRRLADQTADLRQGTWNKKEYGKAAGLKGRVLGIAGLGAIGREVALRAKAFEMDVVAWSRSLTYEAAEELGIERCTSLRELAEKSDVVSVHLALEPATRGLFGAEFFARMKPGAAFVNTSRGGLHDEAALIAAMKARGLRAGLDVYAEEPGGGTASGLTNEVFTLRGFVGTHHVGASTDQAQDAIATEAVRVCREYVLTGRPPNVVNVEQKAPAHSELVVRHYDKVGVLAQVLGVIRGYGLNVADMSNTIFRGHKAAVAVIRVEAAPSPELIRDIAALSEMVIQVEVKRV